MFALISLPIRSRDLRSESDPRSIREWGQRLYGVLVDWLTEPISFPGKWPEYNGSSQRYNGDVIAPRTTSEIRNDG
jgi:hypothetical protein